MGVREAWDALMEQINDFVGASKVFVWSSCARQQRTWSRLAGGNAAG